VFLPGLQLRSLITHRPFNGSLEHPSPPLFLTPLLFRFCPLINFTELLAALGLVILRPNLSTAVEERFSVLYGH